MNRWLASLLAFLAAATNASAFDMSKCTIAEAEKMARSRPSAEIGQGWTGDRQPPWHIAHVREAIKTCDFKAGPRLPELERRAAAYRHPTLSNAELMRQGAVSFANGAMTRVLGASPECLCAMALNHYGPRGIDFSGVVAPR